MCLKSPKLWIVATPIGNLGDVSTRAKEILSQADVILAEDTRKAGVFCSLLGIEKKRFLSLFEHNEEKRIKQVIEFLEQNYNIALISNAGTPIISDPGYKIVKACREKGFDISVIPGPAAPIAALVISGFPPIPFTFLGFLPRKQGAQKELFLQFKNTKTTLIFFERKSRLKKSLEVVFEVLGEREICIAREITKKHEEVIFIRSRKELNSLSDIKGEITVVVSPETFNKTPEDEVENMLKEGIKQNIKIKELIEAVSRQISGWNHKELYKLCVSLKKKIEAND